MVTGRTGTQTTPLGFAGEYTDAESGLQYLRARMYDPATGQFLTRDPLTAVTGQPYGYAGDSPLTATDPTGLFWQQLLTGYVGLVDGATLGATSDVRGALGLNGGLDTCSLAYQVANGAGTGGSLLALAFATGGLGDALEAGALADEVGAGADVGSVEFRADTSHIFRDASGHLSEDTPANRSLLQNAIRPENFVRSGGPGGSISTYRQLLPDGRQVWVDVRNGSEITNGGVNDTPW